MGLGAELADVVTERMEVAGVGAAEGQQSWGDGRQQGGQCSVEVLGAVEGVGGQDPWVLEHVLLCSGCPWTW